MSRIYSKLWTASIPAATQQTRTINIPFLKDATVEAYLIGTEPPSGRSHFGTFIDSTLPEQRIFEFNMSDTHQYYVFTGFPVLSAMRMVVNGGATQAISFSLRITGELINMGEK